MVTRNKGKTRSKGKNISKSKEKIKVQRRDPELTTKFRMLGSANGKSHKYYLATLSTGRLNRAGDAESYQQYLEERGYRTIRVEEGNEYFVYARRVHPNLRSVSIRRVEGGSYDDVDKTFTFSNFAEANSKLSSMARTAPSREFGYHKLDFWVTFKDGSQYSGVYDLSKIDIYNKDHLQKVMKKRLTFIAKQQRPRDLTDGQWDYWKKLYHTPEKRKKAKHLLIQLEEYPEDH